MIAQVARPVGKTVGLLLTIDASLSEMLVHTIIGIPEKIVRELRDIYAVVKGTADTSIEWKTEVAVRQPVLVRSNKREREDVHDQPSEGGENKHRRYDAANGASSLPFEMLGFN